LSPEVKLKAAVLEQVDSVSVTVEALHTVSEANAHDHWRKRQKRAKAQRFLAALSLPLDQRVALPCVVLLTRVAPRTLDDDNNVGALKAVRDGVADWLGSDDRTDQIVWRYAQTRGTPKQYAVRIEIKKLTAAAVVLLEVSSLGLVIAKHGGV
jgi:hypothetical protein